MTERKEFEAWFASQANNAGTLDHLEGRIGGEYQSVYALNMLACWNEATRLRTIDTADTVKHIPSGEEWVVAKSKNGQVYWCGHPFGGSADLSDCFLLEKASAEDKATLIATMGKPNNER